MSNYVQTTFFTPKDSLPANNPAKTIFGAAYDVEFGNIATAIATKMDATTTPSFLNVNVTGATLPANGIYLPATNTLGFATNSIARGSINASGNWTINGASSGTTLTVGASSSGTTTLALTGAASTSSIVSLTAGAGGGAGIKAADGTGTFIFGAGILTGGIWSVYDSGNSAERFKISASGNVTINAPSSGTALTVNGVSSASPLVQFNGASGDTAKIGLTGGEAGAHQFFLAEGVGGSAGFTIYDNTAGASRLTVNGNGAVSINAPSSGATLTLNTLNNIADVSISDGTSTFQHQTDSVHGNYLGTSTAHALHLITNNTNVLSLAADITAASVSVVTIAAPTAITGTNSLIAVSGAAGRANQPVFNFSSANWGQTGTGTATFSASNKPSSGTTAPSAWLSCILNGTTYYWPLWQ